VSVCKDVWGEDRATKASGLELLQAGNLKLCFLPTLHPSSVPVCLIQRRTFVGIAKTSAVVVQQDKSGQLFGFASFHSAQQVSLRCICEHTRTCTRLFPSTCCCLAGVEYLA
jgi:hypothetical protein